MLRPVIIVMVNMATPSTSLPSVLFTVGEKFSSYTQLKEKIGAYERSNCVLAGHNLTLLTLILRLWKLLVNVPQ